MKATKTWREMLNESLEDPHFRKEWEDATTELAEPDKIIASRSDAGLTQADVVSRMGTTHCWVCPFVWIPSPRRDDRD